MKKTLVFAATLASLFVVTAAAHSRETHGHHPGKLLAFTTLYGVDGPFLGDANAIRDVEGDEAPWVVGSARGSLDTAGHLKIRVRGLVFGDDPLVPPDLVGKNDESEFRGLVSCLTEHGDAVETENVTTRGFPASPAGDSTIDAQIALPNPCVAPVVFVLAGSEDKWFAVSGFEAEGDED
jgi:hypothetical protein